MTKSRATFERVVIWLFALPIFLGGATLTQEISGYEGTRVGWIAIFIGSLITGPSLIGNVFRLERPDTPSALRRDARLGAAVCVALYVLGVVFLGSGGFSP